MFDDGKVLRLRVAADGEQLLADGGPLDAPFDMAEYGKIDLADVTESLFPALPGSEITKVEALTAGGKQVGVRLTVEGNETFHFWADGDELHWGDEAALRRYPWYDRTVPKASYPIQV